MDPNPLLLLALLALAVAEPPPSERSALLSFLSKTPHESRIQWNSSTPTCSWVGVTCDPNATTVIALRLPGTGLVGPIPSSTLSNLPSLRILSLHSNRLSGPLPSDFSNLTLLRSLYLHNNLLSGPFPPAIPLFPHLTRLDLSGNNFSGEIPFSLNNLTHLSRLFLQHNHFSGSLPSIDLVSLTSFDVSYNALNGSVPRSLDRFPESSFTGNLDLCGSPLPPCTPFFPAPAPAPEVPTKSSSGGLSKKAIIGISVAGGLIVIILLTVLLVCCFFRCCHRRSRDKPKPDVPPPPPPPVVSGGGESSRATAEVDDGETNRLVFVGKRGYGFDLEDLLRASAEVLGKGSVGTSYKAVLEDGTTVVVKRLKDVSAPKPDFEAHVEIIGRLDEHPNVLPLRAFYYSKDEKLLVYDYLPSGSLSALLHGSRGSGRTPLDWESRARIAMAAGKGLAHLHSAGIVNGNIKASNVILRPEPDSAAISDFGLTPIFPPSTVSRASAGYRAPEVTATLKVTFKSDIYSLGVLILELLTGRAPNQAVTVGGGEDEGVVDLPRWVQSVVREEWTAEVFDAELMRYPGVEEEMVGLLQVAMACVSTMPDSRPDAAEVVRMIKNVVGRTDDEDGNVPSRGGSGAPSPPPASTP
ncbi:probable inactive receptor kinase At2g26730 [Dioscorea cayenensis subsp. rotundata]|uniref:Probable inactive receptor kinase At2g26730 n=1 Tax=Dioscorea cayennensis subsp. rotundata TaxID=55577 RepID=A0AB40BF90_DIOCR|nr:probable inactive receptor kinase At2g26730 [Dioscorea cayenensis subsp. rotundata]